MPHRLALQLSHLAEVGYFDINPKFHAIGAGWNQGLSWKIPKAALL